MITGNSFPGSWSDLPIGSPISIRTYSEHLPLLGEHFKPGRVDCGDKLQTCR